MIAFEGLVSRLITPPESVLSICVQSALTAVSRLEFSLRLWLQALCTHDIIDTAAWFMFASTLISLKLKVKKSWLELSNENNKQMRWNFFLRYRLAASETTTLSDNRRTRRSTSTAQYRSMIMGLGLIRFLFGFTLQLFIFSQVSPVHTHRCCQRLARWYRSV